MLASFPEISGRLENLEVLLNLIAGKGNGAVSRLGGAQALKYFREAL